jgi:hypothetical protein
MSAENQSWGIRAARTILHVASARETASTRHDSLLGSVTQWQ